MCGILGVLGKGAPFAEADFRSALDTLAHRGPDASSIWCDDGVMLGHRRLAIIDLSQAGTQPMRDDASGLMIVFNGEIYNYLEMRTALEEKGHKFRTQTDTEVLLKGYAEWGPAVQDRCNGMWAFVIWDPKTRKAFISRDRFGVKPFYFAERNGQFLFSSEPKALHRLDPHLTEPNPAALVELIVSSRVHVGSQTVYRSISALPAAHCGFYDTASQKLTLMRYWDYPEADPSASGPYDYEYFAEVFTDAVRLRLRSDVEVGLTLSGGLDSTAVLAATKNLMTKPPACFTSVYPREEGGEIRWAQIAADRAGTSLLPVESDLRTWWDTLPKIVHHLDAPEMSPAVLPLWSIMAKARDRNVPVLLEGQGADEALGGYTYHPAENAIAHLRSGRLGAFTVDVWQMRHLQGFVWGAAWLART
ncbi:MAG: asparagine synthase (glutamine-hydrolyzing), partial [Methyloceanibacter sp.]|nr:asparagine synthase (glutamine-hydrolyzing) [Methyloceanibacter sp.]